MVFRELSVLHCVMPLWRQIAKVQGLPALNERAIATP
jgi:hypothetical protein